MENNTNRDQVSQILRTSAEKIAGNEDLLSEILLRLPVRSLIRFKCVSKPWLLLISSSHFSHTHSRKNLPVSGFIYLNRNCRWLPRSVNDLCKSKICQTGFNFVGVDGARPKFPPSLSFMQKSHVRVINSCSGLMLCSTITVSESRNLVDYWICNPTTHKFSSIPRPPLADYFLECGINLIFDPSSSPHFKVLFFSGPRDRLSTDGTHIYSSNSQSWSSLESPDGAFLCPTLYDGVLCNGSLFWLSPDQWKLLCFEVDKQRFTTITMNMDTNVMGIRDNHYSVYLWQSKGKLYIVQCVFVLNVPTDMVVYEMGNVCSEWLVKYMVKFPDAVLRLDTHDYDDSDKDEELCAYTILAAVGGQEEDDEDDIRLLVKLVYNIRERDRDVILYSVTSSILYSIKDKATTKMLFSYIEEEAQPHIESLSPII